MAGKIFYRERIKSKKGAKSPRFRIIAVCDADIKIFGNHFRKKELEHLARAAGADLIELERDKKEEKME
ncbi:hypothetical protein [Desulfogranum japonicum]|uniref:hypothetical protein n=1 Tax=Desulfogranum japonicum TaxID=231447 RepID=UPI00040DF5D1|nr:hypothetical protein [Desulfogranum japonicum]